MKYETNALAGLALEFAAHKELGTFDDPKDGMLGITLADYIDAGGGFPLDWATCGPVIERERIAIVHDADEWDAHVDGFYCNDDGVDSRIASASGPTPLVAAMRAFVNAKMGNVVDL